MEFLVVTKDFLSSVNDFIFCSGSVHLIVVSYSPICIIP